MPHRSRTNHCHTTQEGRREGGGAFTHLVCCFRSIRVCDGSQRGFEDLDDRGQLLLRIRHIHGEGSCRNTSHRHVHHVSVDVREILNLGNMR